MTGQIYDRLSRADPWYYTPERIQEIEPLLERVRDLKRLRRAVLLAHNYQRAEIFEVADVTGDSLELALKAAEVKDAKIIVFCGVHFMAETAKIVNPSKMVLLPDPSAGCSLADSATATGVQERAEELRKVFPDLAIVSYVNTTAEVKALSDICCTSGNAVTIVRSLPNKNILFIPDRNLARHVANNVPDKNIIAWDGACYIHEQITPEAVLQMREAIPRLKVLAHPECRDDVLALADATLSTSGMIDYARKSDATEFLTVTECGLSDLLSIEVPNKQFYRACKICPYMKSITLPNVIQSLEKLQFEITIPQDIRLRAERALRRMFEVTGRDTLPSPPSVPVE
ncbi:MAG: quinolinate synthase NadA [Calditrichaeota bacterium]|nr:quinolinate synthase NadA [Calditrichota bacterium]